jgi:hypothetical protein
MDNFGYLVEEIVGISDFKNEFLNGKRTPLNEVIFQAEKRSGKK